MSGLFGRFRDFVQRRSIYLATTPFAAGCTVPADAVARRLADRLETRRLFYEGAHQLRLKLHDRETLLESVLSQHDVVIDPCRVE